MSERLIESLSIERLYVLTKDHSLGNTGNMDDLKKAERNLNNVLQLHFSVSWKTKNVMKIKIFLLEKKDELNVVWMIKVCWCFKSIKGAPRPGIVYFFVNSKSWITSDVFELYYQV